mgnify:FL=1
MPVQVESISQLIHGLMAQVETEKAMRQKAEEAVVSERAMRADCENRMQEEMRLRSIAGAALITEKASREMAEMKASEAQAKATEMHQMHMAECDKHEAMETEIDAMKERLIKAETEVMVSRSEISRLSVPHDPIVIRDPVKPTPEFSVQVTGRDGNGNIRTMKISTIKH